MFITLTNDSGEKLYVNLRNVLWYERGEHLTYSGKKTWTTINLLNDSALHVCETPNVIHSLIAIAEERRAKLYASI